MMAQVAFRGRERVGRYGVDVRAIDAVAESELSLDREVELYLIDEIGKMECLSERFVAATRALLDSDRRVIATVGQTSGGFLAEVRDRSDAELWKLTTENRDRLADRVVEWVGGPGASLERGLRDP